MKIEKIDENTLKITLPISYFTEKNITIEQFTQNAPEVQEFFCDLMETVEESYGFSFTNSIIKVEASISSHDLAKEVVLILTRTSRSDGATSLVDRYLKRKFAKKEEDNHVIATNADTDITKQYIGSKNNTSDTLVCGFDNFDALCDLAKTVNPLYRDYNSLYELNSKYYLMLKKTNIPSIFFMFHEFGEMVPNSAFLQGYLNEYGRLLILGNALESLAKLS